MRVVASKTFYLDLRTRVWIDAAVKAKAKRTKIKYLSDEYFELMKVKPEIGKYLSLGAKVIIALDGAVYEIVE